MTDFRNFFTAIYNNELQNKNYSRNGRTYGHAGQTYGRTSWTYGRTGQTYGRAARRPDLRPLHSSANYTSFILASTSASIKDVSFAEEFNAH